MTKHFVLRNIASAAVILLLVGVFSGSINWYVQMSVVLVGSALVTIFVVRRISDRWFYTVIALVPFYILFVPSSLYLRSYESYPIWIFGITGSVISYFCARRKINWWLFFASMIVILVVLNVLLLPNYYAFLRMDKDAGKYKLAESVLVDRFGQKIDRDQFRGKVILLDVWHTACAPCIARFPELDDLRRSFEGDSSIVIGVLNIPLNRIDDSVLARKFTAGFAFEKYYLSSAQDAKALNIESVPVILIFDTEMKCQYAGDLNLGPKYIIGNANSILDRLKKTDMK